MLRKSILLNSSTRAGKRKIVEKKIPLHRKHLTIQDLRETLKTGGIPIVLITTYHFDFHRIPHWVIVTAADEHFIYIHDPDQTADDDHEGVISRVHIPIPNEQFLKISRWGKDKVSAAVVIRK